MSGSEPPKPIQWREAERWLAKADEDLVAARLLLAAAVVDPAAFHVQQALEKALKALMVAAGRDTRRTHDLETLAAETNKYWPSLVSSPFPLASASEWYLISRYPDLDEMTPTPDEVAEVLSQVELLITEIKAQAPKQSEPGWKPADNP